MKKHLILISILFFSSSCAISYRMRDNRFDTPETTGEKFAGKIYGGVGHGKEVVLTPDYSQIDVNTKNPNLYNTRFGIIGGDIGVLDWVDLGVMYVGDLGLVVKAKALLVGKNKEKGFKLTTTWHIGAGSENKEENNHTPTSAKMSNSVIGADAIIGYRFSKRILSYASGFFDRAEYDIIQTRGSTSKTYMGKSENYGGNFGLNFLLGDSAELTAELARAKITSGQSRKTQNSYGIMLTFLTDGYREN